MFYTLCKTKLLGTLLLYGEDGYLEGLEFYKGQKIDNSWQKNEKYFTKAIDQLNKYFKKELKIFDIPIKPSGTPFQKKVFSELLKIPYGSTISYQELAKRVGNEKASRAVANANGKNPIAIIIPCHRVIAKNGSIGGFNSGVDIKKELLKLEGIKI